MNAVNGLQSALLVRNALYGSGGRLITLAVGLVMTPYLLNSLGVERFGIWALVAVVTGAMGLLDFSLKSAFIKYLAEAVALRDRAMAAAIISTGLFAYLLFAVVVVVLFHFSGGLILSTLNIPEPLLAEALQVFRIGVAGFLVGSVLSVFPAVVDAHQRMDITNALGVGALIIGAMLMVAAVENGHGLIGIAWAQLAGITVFFLASILAACRIAGPLNMGISAINHEWFARLFAYSWRLHVSSVCMIVNRQFDKLILSRWAGLGVVSAYEVALRMAGNLGTLQPYLAAALLPASSQMHAAGDHQRLLAMYRKATGYLFLVGVPPFIYLAGHSHTVITAWLGKPNELAAVILICLIPGYLVNSLSNAMAFVCQGVGQPGIQARQSALQLGVNVVLSLLLFHLIGPVGAPIGTSIALIVGAAWFARRFHRYLGMTTLPLLKSSALIPLVASLAGWLAAGLATGHMSELGRADALLKLGASLLVFSIVVLTIYVATRRLGRVELNLVRSALRSPGRESSR